ncbi:hypothetical protein D9M70_618880 [compost metagenome]
MPEQTLEHPAHIDPAQRTQPDRRAALGLDVLQGVAQSLLEQPGHLVLAVLEAPTQYLQVLIDASVAVQASDGFLANRRQAKGS